MVDFAQLADTPSKVSHVLAAHRIGVASVVLFVLAAAAPLTMVAGAAGTGFAVTGVLGLPVAYLVVAVVVALFAVGYVAMSRRITNAGAFYSYVAQGVGRMPGVAAGFVALLAYNAIQIGLYGIFGAALSGLLEALFAVIVPWWACAVAGWAVVAGVGVLRADINGRVLAGVLVVECIVVALYDLVFVSHPAAGTLAFDALDPARVADPGWGAALAVAVVAFVGIEGTAVFTEEDRDAGRTVAKGTFTAIVLIGLFYALSSWALAVAGGSGGPDGMFAAGAQYAGRTATHLAQILFVTSLLAALLVFHNTVARYLFSLGRERVLPVGLGSTHYRTGSPYAGSLTQSMLALAVLVAAAAGGVDPVATLFFAGACLGAVGVLVLMGGTSFAVIGYFRRRPGEGSGWHRLVAPAMAGMLLLGVLVLVLANFHRLLGVPAGDPRSWVLPAGYAVVVGAGLLWGWYLKVQRPDVYRAVGLGANRVLSSTITDRVEPAPIMLAADLPTATFAALETSMPGRTVPPVRAETGIVRLHNTTIELDNVTAVLSRAYQTDLPGEWLFPEAEVRASAYPAFFRVLAKHALRGAGEVYSTPDRAAVAIWYPAPYGVPDTSPADYDAMLAAATGPYLPRFLALDAATQAEHPIERAHHYLAFLAVLPGHQGRGLGSALLASRLTELHRRGVPAYLEATNRRNLALFLHHGFTVVGTVQVPDGGPTLYRMWREARVR